MDQSWASHAHKKSLWHYFTCVLKFVRKNFIPWLDTAHIHVIGSTACQTYPCKIIWIRLLSHYLQDERLVKNKTHVVKLRQKHIGHVYHTVGLLVKIDNSKNRIFLKPDSIFRICALENSRVGKVYFHILNIPLRIITTKIHIPNMLKISCPTFISSTKFIAEHHTISILLKTVEGVSRRQKEIETIKRWESR